ncbi:MAG: homogentisate 1,2-dioxygenase [Phycisphaeraceae bacterium]|nr:homogentisate 1,2-dioxygenase [Phycisphaeraceae bacterium]
MPYYMKLGNLPKTRHTQFRRPDGALYSEELFGTEGFVGPTSTLYHIHPPTQVFGWNTKYSTKPEYVETSTMRMRHLKTHAMKPKGDAVTGRVVLFGNADVEMAICTPAEQMSYHFKNGQGDECFFIHYGRGTVHSMFGTLKFHEKDYIVIPKGTIYRIEFDDLPDDQRPQGMNKADMPFGRFVLFETCNASHIQPPPRYLSKTTSQFLEHAPYCERDLRIPEYPLAYDELGDFEVRIKALNAVHTYTYHYHPLDVVGWDGCYYPYIFNIDDFAPIVGKLHMPPPIHQTFEGHNFVICSFCPRMLDFHPNAIVVPYNHSNIDSDEILYYVEGNYKARKGIDIGSISLHPQGIPHGPHPGTVEASLGAKFTNELAVMCDTFRPMYPTKEALALDDAKYPESWKEGHYPLTKDRMHSETGFPLNGTSPNGHAKSASGKGEGVTNVWT